MVNDTLALPLKDILPAVPASTWPPAPIWWVGAFSALLILFICWFARKFYLENYQYRLRALHSLHNIITSNLTEREKLSQVALLIKQTAISAYPDDKVTSLHGNKWVTFLNEKTHKPLFSKKSQDLLVKTQYQNIDHYNLDSFANDVKQWIKRHKKVNHWGKK